MERVKTQVSNFNVEGKTKWRGKEDTKKGMEKEKWLIKYHTITRGWNLRSRSERGNILTRCEYVCLCGKIDKQAHKHTRILSNQKRKKGKNPQWLPMRMIREHLLFFLYNLLSLFCWLLTTTNWPMKKDSRIFFYPFLRKKGLGVSGCNLTSGPRSDVFALETNSLRKPSSSVPSMYPFPVQWARVQDEIGVVALLFVLCEKKKKTRMD